MTQAAADIPAMAFQFLELAALSSFADDSPQAAAAKDLYPTALGLVLEHVDFGFASTLAKLAKAEPPEEEVDDPRLPHAFLYPDGFVKLRKVFPERARWREDDRFIRADQPGLVIRYTRLIDDERRMTYRARLAVALQLAVLMAPRYLTQRTKRADLVVQLDDALIKAAGDAAQGASAESYRAEELDDLWEEVATR